MRNFGLERDCFVYAACLSRWRDGLSTSEVGVVIAGTCTAKAIVYDVSTEDPNHLTKVAREMALYTASLPLQGLI
jgi:hypothetical protein